MTSTTRWLTEMGMGVDVHGRSYTKAARRAVSDAIRHSSVHFFTATGRAREDMRIEVRIGVADPSQLDLEAIAAELPYGQVTVIGEVGGLDVEAPGSIRDENGNPSDGVVMANAAVLVSFEDQ